MFQFRVTTPVALVVDPVRMDAAFFPIGGEAARSPQAGPKGFWQLAELETAETVQWNNMIKVANALTASQGRVIQERLAKA